ncbi:sialoglycan-binding domain-containing protein, partial [Streptococcus infantis]|uniref:sialoglycan-binding domain-containing protein n=1 Tax=Streptococcus infantis TaxID=68892 RepID=UPI0039C2BF19
MEKKSNSLSRVKRRQQEKVLRFSIRKYSFGAASVAVAALMFLGARVVSADSVTPVDQPHVEALTQDTSPLASQDKEEPASSVKVDTATASQLVAQIKDQLHVKEATNTDLLVRAKEELVKAEQTLADSKVSQEEVDALVARLTNVLDQLRAVETPQVKEDKNGESTQEATPEIKPEGVKPTPEISAKSEETSENTNAEQLEKAKASLKVSIDRLEQAIAQTPENDLTREILEKAIAQVAVAKSAFGGVEVSLRDVEDMNRVIKRNESSVMIARNRLTSGRNDVRNGAAIPVGTTLRADAGATYDNAVGLYFTKEGDGSGYPAGTMLFRDRNQNTADNQRVKDVKDVVKVDVTKNGDTYDWVIEFEANPENHQNAHAWFTIPTGHTLVDDGSASFGSYWGGSGGKRRIETQGRLPRNLYDIFKDQVSATSKAVNFGTPGGAIEQAWGKAATTDAFWKGADGEIKTFEEIISKPDALYWTRTGGARTTTEKDVLVSDYLKDWLIRNTQKVYHFDIDYRGRTKDSASNYIFRFKTKAAEGTPLMYAAGMRSYEFSTHRNDMQWYGLPSPKVTGADQTIEKGKEIRLEFTTTDKLAGFSLGDPKLGYNPADSIKLVDSKLELKDQKVEVQKVSDYEHKLIITGRVTSDPGDYKVKVKSVNNVGQSAEFTSTVRVTQSITPTLELNQDPNTGDVTVTPKKPDGSTYPPETKVEIPGKGDKPIPVTIGKDGKGKVPNSELPEGNVPGIGKITEPGQPTVEVPDVTTPGKITPADQVAPTITKLTDNRNAEIDSKNPRKIIVYREEEFSVDVNLTDNSGRLDKIKVHDNAQAVAPSGNFEVTNGGRLELPANGTSINFTDKTSNLGQAGNATDTNPYKVNISGHVGKNQEVKADASKNIWNRYISGYDQGGLTNNDTNNNTANNANIQIEFRKQADKYTPTAVTGSKIDVATDGTISGYNSPETYIANKSDLPTKGTTPGTATTYTWKDGENPTVTNGQVTRTVVVTYPDGSTDEVPVTFTVNDTVPPTITSLTPISNAEIDKTNPHKIIVYREEEFNVDVNLTDNSGRLDKIKVHDNAQAVAPSGNFEVTNGGRLEIPANGTKINFTANTSNLGQAGNATDTNPYKVNISGYVGKGQTINPDASKNIWNRYISGYDQEGLTNNSGNNGPANNANIQIEFRKQADKYTPTAVTGSKIDVATDGTISGYNTPETYIANKSDLPTKGTTPGTATTYTWKDGENPTVTNGQVTRTVVVTYPDGSTDEVPVTFTVNDTVPPTITSLTPISNAEIDKTNPHKIIVYREEEFSVDVNLTDNSGRLDKIKVHDNAQAVAPSGNFEVTNGGRLEIPANGTKINFTANTSNLGQAGNATDTNPYKVNISGYVGKGQTINPDASKNIWNRYISGYDQEGLTNNSGNNGPANNANIQIEFRKQADKYTPTATNPTVNLTSNGTVPDLGSPETYIANKSDLPDKGTTPGTTTTYAWKAGETPTVNNGKVTRTVIVTYPDGSTDEVPVKVTVTTPETPETEKPVEIEITPQPNGDAIVTPKKPDGSTYPPKTTVEIPGENGPITVEIGKDGSGKVPNDNLPKKAVPGTGTVTEPNKKPSQPVNVTTPGKVTPATPETEKPGKIEITQQPNGDAVVTPKKPDGSTYPPKTTVEIPGENGPITVEIGKDGSGKVPNDNLPK